MANANPNPYIQPRAEDIATNYTYVPRSGGPAYQQQIHYQPPHAGVQMNYFPPHQYVPHQQYAPAQVTGYYGLPQPHIGAYHQGYPIYHPFQAPPPDGTFYPAAPPLVLHPAQPAFLPTGAMFNPLAAPFHPASPAPVLHPPMLLPQQAPQGYYYGRTEGEVADDEARAWYANSGERIVDIAPADPKLDDMFYVIELDGTRGQRTFASIEHSCKPGKWVKDAFGSFVFVRHPPMPT